MDEFEQPGREGVDGIDGKPGVRGEKGEVGEPGANAKFCPCNRMNGGLVSFSTPIPYLMIV